MSRKTENASKTKKTTKDGTGAVVLHSDDEIKNLVSQNQALELQLAQRAEISASISRHSQTLEEKLQEVTFKYQEEQNFNLAITRDMTRQYKGMQEELITRLTQRERKIQDLTDDIKAMKDQHVMDLERKDAALQNKDKEISALKVKIDEVCEKFAGMLSTLADHLQQRIDVQSCLKDPGQLPIRKRMEEFRLDLRSTTRKR